MSPLTSAPPAVLVARHLRYDRAGRTVLDDVSLSVGPATRLGVVGPNGVGKSTLLQILAGLVVPAAGDVRLDPPTATVGYLNQEHVAAGDETVRAALYRRTGVAAAEGCRRCAAGRRPALGRRAASRVAERYADRPHPVRGGGGRRFRGTPRDHARTGRTAGRPRRPTRRDAVGRAAGARRSGGGAAGPLRRHAARRADQRPRFRRPGPARRARGPPQRWPGDRVARPRLPGPHGDRGAWSSTSTLAPGRTYGGGWAGYVAEREAERAHAAEAFAVYESQRAELRRRAQRERQWATTGVAREKKRPRDNDKAQRDFRINRTERLAARARQTERALESLEAVEKPWEGWDLHFSISEAARSGDVVVRLEDAVVERGDFTLGPLTLDIGWADRIALVGPNGSGKTTLVQALLGRLPLAPGKRRIGPSVVVGELAQDRRVLQDAPILADAFMAATGLAREHARSQLAKFGLGAAAVLRPSSSLSPGERTRAELAAFAATGVNFLVLDEPTNHLDLPAIEQLESALRGYAGTLLLVSHDRRLLESVPVTRRVELPGGGQAHEGR